MRKIVLQKIDRPPDTTTPTTSAQTYGMDLVVTAAYDMPAEVFVKQRISEDGSQDITVAVASAEQMESLPAEAPNSDSSFFRTDRASFFALNPAALDEIYQLVNENIALLISNLNALDDQVTPPVEAEIIGGNVTFSSSSNVSYSNTLPLALGVAAAGTSNLVSRGDHVHPLPSAAAIGAEPLGSVAAHVGQANPHTQYALLSGSYADPSWITSLAWSKLTAVPTTLAGYGITDALSLTGGTLTGALSINQGPITASIPGISVTQEWNNVATVFTGLLLNVTDTSSAGSSLLADFRVNGVSRLRIAKDDTSPNAGVVVGDRLAFALGNATSPKFRRSGSVLHLVTNNENTFCSYHCLSISLGAVIDTYLERDAAGILAQRNAANAQVFRLYNTFTNSSNYERLTFDWQNTPGTARIGTEKAGTGVARALEFITDGVTRVSLRAASSTVDFTGSISVASGSGFLWSGRSQIRSSTDGVIDLFNNNVNGFNRINFGGTDNTAPALKRTTTIIQARLADDSDFTQFDAKRLTITHGTQVVDQSALDITATWNAPVVTTTGTSGNGTTATITFDPQSFTFPIGSTVVVAGVTPPGYNGSYIVTASTATSVSYASTATGSQTVAGTVQQRMTGVRLNVTDTSSAASSSLLDFQVNSVSSFRVTKSAVSLGNGAMAFQNSGWWGVFTAGAMYLGAAGTNGISLHASEVRLTSGHLFGWTSGNASLALDTVLLRDAANTLALRNSTNAQAFRIYQSYTDANNYARIAINANQIRSEVLGTGSLSTAIDTPVIDLAQAWNSPAITTTGASGTGTTATLTFAAQPSAFPIGSTIIVAGVSPGSYNGTYIVTASTTTSVSYASSASGTQTAAGTVRQRMVAVKVDATDTDSDASSLLLDLKVGGLSRHQFAKDGSIALRLGIASGAISGIRTNGSYTGSLVFYENSTDRVAVAGGLRILNTNIGFTSGGMSPDLLLEREAADTLALRRSTNAQTFRVYNTYTDSSNYERAFFRWNTNTLEIGTEKAGTGGARNFTLVRDGVTYISCNANGVDISSVNLRLGQRIQMGTGSRIQLVSPVDGALVLARSDNTDGQIALQFSGPAGATLNASFPALYREASSTALRCRLGDNSDFTQFEAKNLVLTQGSITAATPALNITSTWNNGTVVFTGVLINVTDTASDAASLIFDVQRNGTSRLSVRPDGVCTAIEMRGTTSVGCRTDTGYFMLGGSADIQLHRDAAATLAMRNGAVAQTFRVYNTFTDASNYERGFFRWSGNELQIGTEKAGTGATRDVVIYRDGAPALTFSSGIGTFAADASARDLYLGVSRTIYFGPGASHNGRIQNYAQGCFAFIPRTGAISRIAFGGSSAAEPALNRSGTILQAKLADDSDFTQFDAKRITLTQGTVAVDAAVLDVTSTWNAPLITTTGASGDGVTATLTFAPQPTAFPVGSTINILNITPTGYNGTYVVTASTTTSVSYANTTTGAQTVAGTIQQRMTGLKFNFTDTASAAASLFLDFQLSGVSQFSIGKTGRITYSNGNALLNAATDRFDIILNNGNAARASIGSNGVVTGAPLGFCWTSTTASSGSVDLSILRDGADILAQRRGTNPQRFRVYNTLTGLDVSSSGNWERACFEWLGNVLRVGTEKAGTGVGRNLDIITDGTSHITLNATTRASAFNGSISIPNGNAFAWLSRGFIAASSDGVLRIADNAGTSFDRLQLGRTDNTAPAIKRNNAEIQIRLADDSDFTFLEDLYRRKGTGSPEGAVVAPIGSIYHRIDGGISTALYVKIADTGAFTGWTSLASIAPVQSVAGKTGTVVLAKGDVGLSNVDNTADADKPVSTAQAIADAAAQAAAEATAAALYARKTATVTVGVTTVLSTPSANTVYVCNCTGANFNVTLPAAPATSGLYLTFKRSGTIGTASIIGAIDTATRYVLEFDDEFVVLFSDGTTYKIVAE